MFHTVRIIGQVKNEPVFERRYCTLELVKDKIQNTGVLISP
jgi:hypothetical protein